MTPRGSRPRDPHRRQRIVLAARELARESGVGAITHRAAATRAGVPLGSTTYYFSTIEDLLAEAVREEITDQQAALGARLEGTEGLDAATRIIRLVPDDEVDEMTLFGGHDLYLTALARPGLRPLAAEWMESFIALLSTIVPRDHAEAVATLMDGYGIRVAMGAPADGATMRRSLERHVRALLRDDDHS